MLPNEQLLFIENKICRLNTYGYIFKHIKIQNKQTHTHTHTQSHSYTHTHTHKHNWFLDTLIWVLQYQFTATQWEWGQTRVNHCYLPSALCISDWRVWVNWTARRVPGGLREAEWNRKWAACRFFSVAWIALNYFQIASHHNQHLTAAPRWAETATTRSPGSQFDCVNSF